MSYFDSFLSYLLDLHRCFPPLIQVGKSIDWGVVCVFTCSESCDIPSTQNVDLSNSAYRPEFVVKQDVGTS